MQPFGNLSALAEQYGTPLVVYSEAHLVANAARLRSALPEQASVAYSIKANPNPSIVRLLHRQGLMAEAASAGELALALRSQVPPGQLMLGGPAKRPEAIQMALDHGIFAILVESGRELERVKVAASADHPATVLLRVNPTHVASQSVLRMAGVASPFGIDESELPTVLRCFDNGNVRYGGLFLYAGSQCFRAADIVENTRYLCCLALRLLREGFPPPQILDFGGGFGVPEDDTQPDLDLAQLRQGLATVFARELAELVRYGLKTAIFESGRYLVNTAAVYVTRVLDVKRSHGQLFAILDGGLNNLGVRQMMYRTFEPSVGLWGKDSSPLHEELVTLVGPSCTPVDVVHKGCPLPTVEPGDLVVIRNYGAYGLSYSPVHFCGHPTPAEVLAKNDGTHGLVRERGRLEEACGLGYLDY